MSGPYNVLLFALQGRWRMISVETSHSQVKSLPGTIQGGGGGPGEKVPSSPFLGGGGEEI